MKIGILAIAPPKSGGVYQYTQSIVDSLLLDKQNRYVVFTDTENTEFEKMDGDIRTVDPKQINLLQKILSFLFFCAGIKKPHFFSIVEKRLFEDIDLFISPAISLYPHIFLKRAYIITIHDMQERYFPGFFPIKEKILRYITKKMVTNYATHILCESNFVKNDIIKFLGITQDKISVIPGPPVLHFFHTKHDEKKLLDIKTKYNLPEYFIIYPAHFWPHKNHLRLLDAFAQVSKEYSYVHLLLTGSKQNYYNKVVTKIEDLGLKEKVHYLGYVCYDDLPALYKMSKMLVMPSLFESISIPVYEAFALKVPVCCSNVGALPEQVGNGGLTFDPNNPDDIAEKIGCVLRDEKLAKNLAGKGYNIVQNLTHKRYSERLVEVIERCTVI